MPNLLARNQLFFSQKAKFIELTSEFRIADELGNPVGFVRQEGQSKAKKVLRLVSSLDQFLTHHLVVYDADGSKVCALTRPAKFMKSKVLVEDATGQQVGVIQQQNVIGKIRFTYEDPKGVVLGEVNAENWRAWNFSILDDAGTQVGRITKKWAGAGRELFTTADNYLFELTGDVSAPFRILALASAAGIDLALKQDSK